MPPTSRSPVSRARSQFFDEPEAPEFFVPVGQGRTSFGSYISPALAASARLEMDADALKRDKDETTRAENFTRRLEAGSRSRILPYSEKAAIAGAKLNQQKSESGSRLNPFDEQQHEANSQLQTAKAKAELESLPEDEAYSREKQRYDLEKLQAEDPYARRFRKPEELDLYQRFNDAADESLPEKARKQWALSQTARLSRDSDTVRHLNEAAYLGDKDADALIETVTDKQGNIIGQKIKEDADPQKVAGIVMRHQRATRDADIKRKGLEKQQGILDDTISQLSRRVQSWEAAQLKLNTTLPPDTEEIAKYKQDIARLSKVRWNLSRMQLPPDLQKVMDGDESPAAAPATTPAAQTPVAPQEPVDQVSLDSIYKRIEESKKK